MSWPLVKLDDVATLLRGVTFSSDDSVGQPCENYLPVLRAGNIQEKLYMEEGLIWIPEDKIKENQKIKENDIVMCTSSGSADLVGKCAKSLSNWNGSFGAFCAGIRANPKKVDASYLYHFLCSPMFRTWTKKSSGANIKNIRISELGEFKLPLPPSEEQKRIATILDKADAIRRKRQQAIKLADDFLRSVFLEMFGDPVTNPKGWEITSLSNLVSKLGDGLHGTPVYDCEGEYYFINGNNLDSGKIIIGEAVKRISQGEYEKHKKDLNENTVLVSINGTIGKVAFYNGEKIALGKSACYFNLIPKAVNKTFLYHLISSDYFKNYVSGIVTGSTIKNVSLKSMREFPVLLPPTELQERFSAIEIRVKIMLSRYKNGKSLPLFETLSQKAFLGTL